MPNSTARRIQFRVRFTSSSIVPPQFSRYVASAGARLMVDWSTAYELYMAEDFEKSLQVHSKMLKSLQCVEKQFTLIGIDRENDLKTAISRLWFNVGIINACLGEYFLSCQAFHDGLVADPTCAAGWMGLGIAKFELRYFEDSAKAFQSGVELYTHSRPEAQAIEVVASYLELPSKLLYPGVNVEPVAAHVGTENEFLDALDRFVPIESAIWSLARDQLDWNTRVARYEKLWIATRTDRRPGGGIWLPHPLPAGLFFGPEEEVIEALADHVDALAVMQSSPETFAARRLRIEKDEDYYDLEPPSPLLLPPGHFAATRTRKGILKRPSHHPINPTVVAEQVSLSQSSSSSPSPSSPTNNTNELQDDIPLPPDFLINEPNGARSRRRRNQCNMALLTPLPSSATNSPPVPKGRKAANALAVLRGSNNAAPSRKLTLEELDNLDGDFVATTIFPPPRLNKRVKARIDACTLHAQDPNMADVEDNDGANDDGNDSDRSDDDIIDLYLSSSSAPSAPHYPASNPSTSQQWHPRALATHSNGSPDRFFLPGAS